MNNNEIKEYIEKMAALSDSCNGITPEMYIEHKVNRGLRDLNGKGVVTGLTEVSTIIAKEIDEDGNELPCDGELYYRGINVRDIISGYDKSCISGFEEAAYLLLFSKLPDKNELTEFCESLSVMRKLPDSFTRDMILKAPGKNVMNILSRSVLALYAYDNEPDDITTSNVLRQSMELIALFPMLAVYAYRSYAHYHLGESLYIHNPDSTLGTAANLLQMLRHDGKYTEIEAKVLDTALILHAEHGGGNNSTFTTHVVTSSGTDTYSAISAALGSLKGPRHGGANIKVVKMFDDMRANINVSDKSAVKDYLIRLLDKNAFDNSGLIYGMGHAIYS